MQFHTNGFRAGNPRIFDAAARQTDAAQDEVDVLIVGCGPAGLTLAAQLSAFAGIKTCIIDQKDGPMEKGQADGISCRSMEMFNAFGFAEEILKEAQWINETTFWKPDPADPARIARNGRVQDVEDGLSEMPHVVLNQARVHDMYLEVMRNSPARLEPVYGLQLRDLSVGTGDYPVTAVLERTGAGHAGETRCLRARYVVGCDGARSNVRRAIGRELTGDSAHQAWGVMDILAVTDFPDVRMKSIIQSDSEGSLLLIPREGGHLFRLYVEMDKLSADERVAQKNLTVDHLIAAANRILPPYAIDVKDVVWWSVYEIGHRLTDGFDDVKAGEDRLPRVFIAGDACHTHSPKAGQGMNVSMGDTFNLGWKLVHVLTGRAAPDLLRSYSAERKAVAQGLIDFDHAWSRIISERAEVEAEAGTEAGSQAAAAAVPKFQKHFIEHGRFTAGVSVRYAPSDLTGAGAHQPLAAGFEIGTRFHSAPVIRLCDAKPMHLGHVVEADTRWRLFAFCGPEDPTAADAPIRALCDYLAQDPASPILRHTRKGEALDAIIDLRAVFQQHHHDIRMEGLPDLLMPRIGTFGLQDREKTFCPDLKSGDDLFDMRGIDRAKGALLILRPDQYVADILPMHDFAALSEFFDRVLLRAKG